MNHRPIVTRLAALVFVAGAAFAPGLALAHDGGGDDGGGDSNTYRPMADPVCRAGWVLHPSHQYCVRATTQPAAGAAQPPQG